MKLPDAEYEQRVLATVEQLLRSVAGTPVFQNRSITSVELAGDGLERHLVIKWHDARYGRDRRKNWEIYGNPTFEDHEHGIGPPDEVADWVFVAVAEA